MKPLKTAAPILVLLACANGAAFAQQAVETAIGAEFLAGRFDGETASSAYGTLTLPVGQRYGVHLEGLGDRYAGDKTFGVGAHGYWTDGDRGLFGLIAGTHRRIDVPELGLSNQKVDLFGVEGEAYFETVTLAGQLGRLRSGLPGFDGKTYAVGEVHWTPDSSWYLYGGARREGETDTTYGEVAYDFGVGARRFTAYGGVNAGDFDLGYLGIEFHPATSGKTQLSVFAEVQRGESGYDGFLLGLRLGIGAVDKAPVIPLFATAARGFR